MKVFFYTYYSSLIFDWRAYVEKNFIIDDDTYEYYIFRCL